MTASRRRTLFALGLCTMLSACASLVGPRQVDVPLSRMQHSLEGRFPLSHKVLEVFTLELRRPQLSVVPEGERVSLAMDANLSMLLGRNEWNGNMIVSGRLALDPQRNAVLLAQPRIDRLMVEGGDESRQRQLAKVANLLLDNTFSDLVLYRFRPEDLRVAGVQFMPTQLLTSSSGVSVRLEPVR